MSRSRWTLEKLEKEAAKFSSLFDWRKKSPSSYVTACRLGLSKKLSSHMKTKRREWTKDEVIKDASKYENKSEWRKRSSAYQIAHKNNWIEEATAHMKKPDVYNKIWYKDKIFEEAKNFKSKREWELRSNSSYQAARRLGILEEASKHMRRVGGTSSPEKFLIETIKQRYPKAQSAWFKVKDSKFHPAKRFQLDIYIPELRKGIEFNGDYWHSFEGLKRGRPSWTDEQIENYHELKKVFFQSKKINVLMIQESSWKSDQDRVLKEIESFLNKL